MTVAGDKVEAVEAEIETAKSALQSDIAALTATYDPAALKLETETLKPTRTGVDVQKTALLWLPE